MSPFCRLFPERRNPQAPKGAFLLRYSGSDPLFHATDIRPFPVDEKHLPCGDEIHFFAQVSAFPDTPQLLPPLEMCPFFHSGDHLRMGPFLSSGNGTPQGPGRTLLISSAIRSGPFRTWPPSGGRPGSAALFFLSVYLPRYGTVLSCKKEHKTKDREPLAKSFPVFHTKVHSRHRTERTHVMP